MADLGTARFKLLERQIKREIPGFKIGFKTQSRFHRFIGWLISPFNKRYMTDYITTIGKTVWFPSPERLQGREDVAFEILSHEFVHLWDGRKAAGGWFGFGLGYLFPQWLAVLSLGAVATVASLWFLFFLVALLALAPFPAPFRARAEARGYALGLRLGKVLRRDASEAALALWLRTERARAIGALSGPEYYFPEWGKRAGTARLDSILRAFDAGEKWTAEKPFSIPLSIASMTLAEIEGQLSTEV